jgi:hypothetical protein
MDVKQSFNNNTIKIESMLRKYVSQGEEVANSLLGTNITCPRVKINEFNTLFAARYDPKEKMILVNQEVLRYMEPSSLEKKMIEIIAHETAHHIQHIASDSDDYLESACTQFGNALREAAAKASLHASKGNLNTINIAEYITNKDVKLFQRSIDRLIGEEALAYFISAYASVSTDKSIDMYMKRTIMLRSLMFLIHPSDLINNIFNKDGLASSFIKDINNGIWGFNGKIDEFSKNSILNITLGNINGEAMIERRMINSGTPYKIAILAFAENNFSVLKTAQFLFRSYKKVINDLQKAEAASSENLKKIDMLYLPLIRWQSYKSTEDAAGIIRKSIRKDYEEQQEHKTLKKISATTMDFIKKYKSKK